MEIENYIIDKIKRMQYEYAIIGGGIAGLYASYKLNNSDSKGLFESTYRFGGRMITEHYNSFRMEYGPSHFLTDKHHNLMELIQTLGMRTSLDRKALKASDGDVPPQKTYSILDTKLITEDERLMYEDYMEKGKDPVLGLLKLALSNILGHQWDFKVSLTSDERDKQMELLKKVGRYNDRPLWEYGFWDLICSVMSPHALEYIKSHKPFYHMIEYNLNALCHICYLLTIIPSTESNTLGHVCEGMEHIIKRLLASIEKHTHLHPSHRLISFIDSGDRYKLTFLTPANKSVIVHAKHVLFCCNLYGIRQIKGFPQHISGCFEKVVEIALFKVFVIIKNPPWKGNDDTIKYYNKDNVPCREIHYTYDRNTDVGEMMIYGGAPSINYWKYYCKNQTMQIDPEINNNKALLSQIEMILNRLFPDTDKFDIVHYSIKDWSSAPYPAGVHFWKPNVNVVEVLESLHKFDVRGHAYEGRSLHICGEAFSFAQGYIESALTSVNEALSTLTGVSQPTTKRYSRWRMCCQN